METRARYILVGAFTLLSFVAALGFILWLAKVQIDRTFAQYDILFDNVSGLGQGSAVYYNGIDVGDVLNIAMDLENPSLVRVRIEIYASTPVRMDTMATLASQGVTGVSYVALEGGSPQSERLVVIPPNVVAIIPSKPSVVQGLITDAPDLLAEAIALMRDIRGFTTEENTKAIAAILKNVESATARIDTMATRTETVMISAEATLARLDAVLVEAKTTFESGNGVIQQDLPALVADLRSAARDIGQTAAGLEEFARTGLPAFGALASEARGVVAGIGALAERIGNDPGRFLLGTQTPAYRR
jgi:phospholipid/cholesterol/gamma-HCH transport system substrate-binding protein